MQDPEAGTAVAVELSEELLLGLHALAALEGAAVEDRATFQALVGYTLRCGVEERFGRAGLPWPPTPDAAERAASLVVADRAAGGAAPAPTGGDRVRFGSVAAIMVAAVVVVVGGYGGRWSWTGFQANNQLWDWLQLLLLPVAIGTFPLWLHFSEHMSMHRRRALGLSVLAFSAFVAAGYLTPLLWTGFRGQTLWNWLTLLLLPLSVTTVTLWPTTSRRIRVGHLVAAGALAAGWVATLVGGYAGGWKWTGYPGNTLWDWLQLLLAPVALNTVVVPRLAKMLTGHAAERADQEAAREARQKALAAARERLAAAR